MTLKRKKTPKLTLLYVEEHKSCPNYISDSSSGFSQQFLEKKHHFTLSAGKQFVVIFMKYGEIEIISEFGEVKKVCADELCLLNYKQNYMCNVLQNSFLTMLYFEYPKIKCDKYSLLSLIEHKKAASEENIRTLTMKEPIRIFTENLSLYLDNKMMCRHLHDLKESEWLFLMRGFYTKEDSAYFLEPIINSLDSFSTLVKDNYLTCDSVRELAEKCNMSEKTFTRRFKEHFNDTPKQWIMKEKAKYVKSELSHSDLNIKEIADKFGFSSAAHLTNYYKKQFNVTPSKNKNKTSVVKNI